MTNHAGFEVSLLNAWLSSPAQKRRHIEDKMFREASYCITRAAWGNMEPSGDGSVWCSDKDGKSWSSLNREILALDKFDEFDESDFRRLMALCSSAMGNSERRRNKLASAIGI